MAEKTGWERERRKHFDEIVEAYDKTRWEYPRELYEDVLKYCTAEKKSIEIGAGTGIATLPFLEAGFSVTAVEMGENMADFLMKKFGANKNFSVINSTFEEASLQDESYDLIYAASAFHWVDEKIGGPKVFRLLKSGGAFALFRNNQMPSVGEEPYDSIRSVYEKYYDSHYKNSQKPVRKTHVDFLTSDEIHRSFRCKGLEHYGFVDIEMKFYDASQMYNADERIALMDTFSDHRELPKENRERLYSGVKEAIIKHGGQLRVDSIFQLYMGRKH
ncbi:MAG: class I SAM-dependent methyltransferase [Clostridiales bacterium]|nr:class I SAM-dependent methyltransferase [Clostridiales bacterium]